MIDNTKKLLSMKQMAAILGIRPHSIYMKIRLNQWEKNEKTKDYKIYNFNPEGERPSYKFEKIDPPAVEQTV